MNSIVTNGLADNETGLFDLLPDLHSKDVIDLSKGLYSLEFAKRAKTVVVNFGLKTGVRGQEFPVLGNHDNITVIQKDVLELVRPEKSVDVVFSDGLLMFLDDEEVQQLLKRVLCWLRDDGYFFIKESCFHQAREATAGGCGVRYREPAVYNSHLSAATVAAADGQGVNGLDIVVSKATHTHDQSHSGDICWLVQKVHRHGDANLPGGFKSFQQFLDDQQYTRTGILRYEKIFGKHFVSTGGLETTEDFVKLLHLKPGQRVLDVGAGIGGGAFYMAQNYGAHVTGIDLSYNMVAIAMERASEIGSNNVEFEVGDATKREFVAGTFDVVYSRDTILHIPGKKPLFEKFLKWLRPGGKLLISDYCCSDGIHSAAFQEYVKQRGYALVSPAQYGKMLEEAGFINVSAKDTTSQFVEVLKKELVKLEEMKTNYIEEFSQADYDAIADGWRDKLHRCGQGDQRWGLFYAEKAE